MAYITHQDILTLISGNDIIPYTDDNNDGIQDNGLMDSIIEVCSRMADGYVASIYQTPFADPVPSAIKTATLYFVAESLQSRRLAPTEKNMFTPVANVWRNLLTEVGAGKQPLDSGVTRKVTPGFGIITTSRLSVDEYGDPISLM